MGLLKLLGIEKPWRDVIFIEDPREVQGFEEKGEIKSMGNSRRKVKESLQRKAYLLNADRVYLKSIQTTPGMPTRSGEHKKFIAYGIVYR